MSVSKSVLVSYFSHNNFPLLERRMCLRKYFAINDLYFSNYEFDYEEHKRFIEQYIGPGKYDEIYIKCNTYKEINRHFKDYGTGVEPLGNNLKNYFLKLHVNTGYLTGFEERCFVCHDHNELAYMIGAKELKGIFKKEVTPVLLTDLKPLIKEPNADIFNRWGTDDFRFKTAVIYVRLTNEMLREIIRDSNYSLPIAFQSLFHKWLNKPINAIYSTEDVQPYIIRVFRTLFGGTITRINVKKDEERKETIFEKIYRSFTDPIEYKYMDRIKFIYVDDKHMRNKTVIYRIPKKGMSPFYLPIKLTSKVLNY